MAEGDEQDQGETQPSAESGTDPGAAPPPLGELPQRVPERDLSATRVTPAAYVQVWEADLAQPPQRGGFSGCLLRMGILGLFAIIAVTIGVASFGLYQY